MLMLLQLDAYIAEAEDMEREAAIFHNSRIPKSLIIDRKDFCRCEQMLPFCDKRLPDVTRYNVFVQHGQ